MFILGQVFPIDTPHRKGPVNVRGRSIKYYKPARDENRAFLYLNDDEMLVACGLLAVDKHDRMVKVVTAGNVVINVPQQYVYKTNEWLSLSDGDKASFRPFYPYIQ
jgi:hypothetical protein